MTESRVVHEADVASESWSDLQRGEVSFRSLFGEEDRVADGLTLGVSELAPGGWLGLHRHEPAEVYYVVAGSGVVVVDGHEHQVAAGSAVHIAGDAEHGVRNTGDDVLRVVYAFAVGSFSEVEYRFTEAR